MTPLDWGLWQKPHELALRGAFYDMGVLKRVEVRYNESVDDRYLATFYGRSAGNINLMRLVGDRMPGTTADAVEEQIFGGKRSSQESRNDLRRYPIVAAKFSYAVARGHKRIYGIRADNHAWWGEATAPPSLRDHDGASARFVEGVRRFGWAMRPHSLITMAAQASYDQLRALCEKAGREGLESSLATGYGEMEEVEITSHLWEVSRGRMDMKDFLARHGYHSRNEGALRVRSWREDPAQLDGLIETYRKIPEEKDPRRAEADRRAERERAETQLLEALPAYMRPSARVAFALAARHISLREVGKAAFLQGIDGARAAARTHGEWLARRGAIDDPEDVFFLEPEELVSRRTHGLRELVAERRAEREEFLRYRIPDSFHGTPEPIPIEPAGDGGRPEEVEGLPVSPGVVKGRARVIDDPDSAVEVDEGEVLVCETTDPSWASFFFVAGAVVIDIGGPMSHGAIVAREMGIPCVINTRNGTSAIRSGDLLRVDGGTGKVTVLERGTVSDRV